MNIIGVNEFSERVVSVDVEFKLRYIRSEEQRQLKADSIFGSLRRFFTAYLSGGKDTVSDSFSLRLEWPEERYEREETNQFLTIVETFKFRYGDVFKQTDVVVMGVKPMILDKWRKWVDQQAQAQALAKELEPILSETVFDTYCEFNFGYLETYVFEEPLDKAIGLATSKVVKEFREWYQWSIGSKPRPVSVDVPCLSNMDEKSLVGDTYRIFRCCVQLQFWMDGTKDHFEEKLESRMQIVREYIKLNFEDWSIDLLIGPRKIPVMPMDRIDSPLECRLTSYSAVFCFRGDEIPDDDMFC